MTRPRVLELGAAADVTSFFDEDTATFTHLLVDAEAAECAIVDSVRGYDAASGHTSTRAADRLAQHVRARGLTLRWLLETHVHADHLSAAPHLRRQLGGEIVIGRRVTEVQAHFAKLFDAEPTFRTDGSQFDRLLAEGDEMPLGRLRLRVWETPGHTSDGLSYLVLPPGASAPACAFVGDTLFAPDYGTARADFPGGDAGVLHDTLQRLLSLPDDTPLLLCHDYVPEGRPRPVRAATTVAEQRHNVHLRQAPTRDRFVRLRQTRDATLGQPRLLLPSVQVNMRAGHLPPPAGNGRRYLKIPLDAV